MDYILTQTLPGIDTGLLRTWLGERWMLVHRSHYDRSCRWSSIVSSRISQTYCEFRDWPNGLTRALQLFERQQRTCLVVPSTTTATWIQAGTMLSHLSTLHVEVEQSTSVYQWFIKVQHQLEADGDSLRNWLCISPGLTRAETGLEEFPIQDRVAMALGHSVIALNVRPRGTLDQLMQRRLQDSRFPVGTVSVRLNRTSTTPTSKTCSQRRFDPQAVGWFVPASSQPDCTGREHPLKCRRPHTAARPSSQLIAPIEMMHNWAEYLAHCVRGDPGRSDRAHSDQGIAERWFDHRMLLDTLLSGRFHQPSAFQTLLKILSEGRLRASHKLLRGDRPLLSFSAVPLPQLLARRNFQSHLGRWDWEPFGLLIRRDYLQQVGAKPVIYGDDHLYQQLSEADRAFYQPARRRSAKSAEQDWQSECEWRLPNDLRLVDVPLESLMLFVENQYQAQALAHESRWPVIWLRRCQTPPLPTASRPRRRNSARTSRN